MAISSLLMQSFSEANNNKIINYYMFIFGIISLSLNYWLSHYTGMFKHIILYIYRNVSNSTLNFLYYILFIHKRYHLTRQFHTSWVKYQWKHDALFLFQTIIVRTVTKLKSTLIDQMLSSINDLFKDDTCNITHKSQGKKRQFIVLYSCGLSRKIIWEIWSHTVDYFQT